MELAVILVLIAISFIYFRNVNSVIYTICTVDIFFRIVTKIETLINVDKFSFYVNKYIPNNILSIIDKYTSGLLNTIFVWIYIGIYLIFLVLVIKSLFNKKRR